MNRLLGVVLVMAIAVGIVPYARSVETPRPPPGISAGNWVAMGDAAGFVITGTSNDFHRGLKNEPHVINGYFMVRHKDFWVRVDASSDAEVHPANLGH